MRIARALHILFVALVLAGLPTHAYAYLDPSTGAMLLSAVVSVVVTASLAVQAYWYRILRAMRRWTGLGSRSARARDEENGSPSATREESRP